MVGEEGFGDLVADAQDRVEGGHGLLEDHGDAAAAEAAHGRLGEGEEGLAVEGDGAGHGGAAGGSRRRRAREVADLPEPDSPTRPRVSPGAMWKEMPWTTGVDPKERVRSRTSSRGGTGMDCR